MSKLIALTGATGFIGRHLLADLPRRGYRVRVLLRRPTEIPAGASGAVVGDLTAPRNMAAALEGADAVIHSAGLAHAMSGTPQDDHRALNTDATVGLARAAHRAGAKRFVFLSSIRAQSGPTAAATLCEEDEPRPTDDYGRSKLAAEQGLAGLDLDWVALRPVLVYGAGVKGNMAALVSLAASRLALPLGGFTARRSLLAVDNLAEAIDAVLRRAAPLRRPLIVADPDPLTVAEIVTHLRAGMGRGPRVFALPPSLVAAALRLRGRGDVLDRLANPLVVDTSALSGLGYAAALPSTEGLRRLGAAARAGRSPGSLPP